jgi:hypothetical protein
MNHQPFEDWLLNDERLTAGEEWELNLHLRGCTQCAKLAHTNRVLRAAPTSTPPAGFVLRFQEKLIAERKAKRIRNMLGLTLILVVGLGVILLLVPAYMTEISTSPTQLAVTWSTRLVYIGLTLRSIAQTGNLFADLTAIVPSYVWVLSLTALVGSAFLWLFSSRRFTRFLEARGRNQSATFGDRR